MGSLEAGKALSRRQFKDLIGPKGAEVIVDPVGDDYVDPALLAIA